MRLGAIILGAGFGTRLAPLTDHTPKPLLRVGGRPVVSHLLDRLTEIHNLDHVVVIVNDRHVDQWHDWIADYAPDTSVTIESNGVTTEAQRRGAVSDLAQAVSALQTVDWIVVLAGDNLIDETLQPHIDAATSAGNPAILCRDLGDDVPAGRFGEVTVDSDQLVTRFREKPQVPESPLAATCTYVLPGDITEALTTYLATGNADSPGEFIAWLAATRPVLARTLTGRYFDIGNHETLKHARSAWVD